ncbi:MAG TPA: GNAT family N-acetyltransferase [Amnibacterium sp.]|uniref:GNAT family N-acetyltransferase n=1 Tax=Amnibacterium sp. TaxID=1872496 RepID=UPI002F947EAD
MTIAVRRAGAADAAALVRLRAEMYADMGDSSDAPDAPDAPWRPAAEAWFTAWLPRTDEVAAFVVDEPGVGPVACALGLVEHPPPSPSNPVGIRGHVSQVSTLPAFQRRGYARACVTALLDWFERETDARRLDLSPSARTPRRFASRRNRRSGAPATTSGEPRYRSLGFTPSSYPALRLRLH